MAAAVAAGVLVIGGLGAAAVLGSGDVPASAAGAQHTSTGPTVVARPGDSLWTIAEATYERHGGSTSMSFERYVDVLVELNDGPSLDVGQLVRLPSLP